MGPYVNARERAWRGESRSLGVGQERKNHASSGIIEISKEEIYDWNQKVENFFLIFGDRWVPSRLK